MRTRAAPKFQWREWVSLVLGTDMRSDVNIETNLRATGCQRLIGELVNALCWSGEIV